MSHSIKLEVFKDFPRNVIDNTNVPVFCTVQYADYLKRVQFSDVIWFVGFLKDKAICILPFCLSKKLFFKRGEFLTSTVSIIKTAKKIEAKFLELVISYIKEYKICDWIQQSPNWAIFKTVPLDSIYCEFSTYKIDLSQNHGYELLNRMHRDHKQHIRQASKDNRITIQSGLHLIDDCIEIFSKSTAKNSVKLPTKRDIEELVKFLPGNIQLYVAYFNNIPQSCVIYFSDNESLYAVYAAKLKNVVNGLNHLLHWKAMLNAKENGIRFYDLVGSRINPIEGSKLAGLKHFKSHFGGDKVIGYLWKLPISKTKYYLCCCLRKLFYFLRLEIYKGDIIDQERKRSIKYSRNNKFIYSQPTVPIASNYVKEEKEYSIH